jgi:predicted DNA-binding transcriptional regulator AlpA
MEAKALDEAVSNAIKTYFRYEDLPDYLTFNELREWLRLGENKGYRLVNTKGFPVLRYAGKKLYPKAEVREYMKRRTEQGMLPKRLRAV